MNEKNKDYIKFKILTEKNNTHKDDIIKLKLLAEDGDPNAQFKIAQYYSSDEQNDISQKEAHKWYLLSANQKNGDARASLAIRYLMGIGGEKNIIMASMWAELTYPKIMSTYPHGISSSIKKRIDSEINEAEKKQVQNLVSQYLKNENQ